MLVWVLFIGFPFDCVFDFWRVFWVCIFWLDVFWLGVWNYGIIVVWVYESQGLDLSILVGCCLSLLLWAWLDMGLRLGCLSLICGFGCCL